MIWTHIRAQFTGTRIRKYLANLAINGIVFGISFVFVFTAFLMAAGFNPYT